MTGTPDDRARVFVVVAAAIAAAGAAVALARSLAPPIGIPAAVAVGAADLALVAAALVWTLRSRAAGPIPRRFAQAFDQAPVAMGILTQDLVFQRTNAAMCRLLDRDKDELIGHGLKEFTHPADLEDDGGGEPPQLTRYVRPDGAIVEALVTVTTIEPDGGDSYMFAQLHDVTRHRRESRRNAAVTALARRALESSDETALLGEAMRMTQDVIGAQYCVASQRLANGSIRVAAASVVTDDYTVPPEEGSQSAYTLLVNEPVISNDLPSETRFSAPSIVLDLGLHRCLSVPIPEPMGPSHVIAVLRHAHEPAFTDEDARFVEAVAGVLAGMLDRSATELELRRRALEDPLTGLANRALLLSQLDAELRRARQVRDDVYVLALDLDQFKVVNDTLGHAFGDQVLRTVAAQLTSCVRPEDLVARSGGDEFTVICTRQSAAGRVSDIAQRLVSAVNRLLEIEGHELFLTASVGIVVSSRAGEAAEELLRDAESAMYRAKELGGGRYETFDMTLRHRLVARREIETELRHALARNQFELEYQPLIELTDERIVGFEALLRWRHPERGLIPPDDFIQLAEDTGLIVPIGSWVLRQVCAQLAAWPERLSLSANLSAKQITPELVVEVERYLLAHGVEPSRLVLEITERLVLDPHVKSVVVRLRELGVQLALDDFGTGYSSLGSLQRFPLDLVKLDRTLTASLAEDTGAAVVRAAVDLGRALGMDVIAEGIEHPHQLATLKEFGCAFGQGFLFARPMAPEAAERLLESGLPGRRPSAIRRHAA
jgi:diguanylate cyclase (GGDEF)-like protein/PAS domain S-box-containing protein